MILLPQHKKAVEQVRKFIDTEDFYLAGGTALYYYLGHRDSIDLDFFTQKEFDFVKYSETFRPYTILFRSKDTIHADVEQVKMSFFHYSYKLLRPLGQLDIVPIASIEDILCMKISAIIDRGSRKDFTDVYFIMQKLSLTPERVIELFVNKYGTYNPLVINKAMTYFVDADREAELKLFRAVEWGKIKDFFIKMFTKI
ncbi:MAG: hypothetical protein A2W23_08250 [Planctomycetes bacterium RBG_16_43_13]|nr:MAG: hypothetical protein A2W23_08250 [Planctomycetes bacterium RBG_16_43_13]